MGLYELGGDLAVVFRGSAQLHDWLHDIRAIRVNFSELKEFSDGVSVHRGFLAQWREVIDELSQDINAWLEGMALSFIRVSIQLLAMAKTLVWMYRQ